MKILAISGSLRAASHNTALLRAAALLAPANLRIELYDELGKLPLFNPDIAVDDSPFAAHLRAKLIAADAVLIASPEYAHGITGALKNALDWMVSTEAFVNKPVALFNAAPRAVHAQASLRETLSVMSASVIDDACITLPIPGSDLNAAGMVAHPKISSSLRAALQTIQSAISVGGNGLTSTTPRSVPPLR